MKPKFRVGIVGAVSSYSLHYGQTLWDMPGIELASLAYLGRDPKYIKQPKGIEIKNCFYIIL